MSLRPLTGRLRRFLALALTPWLVLAVVAVPTPPAYAETLPPIEIRLWDMRTTLMSQYMRLHGPGRQDFFMDAVLTDDLLRFTEANRDRYPAATFEGRLLERYATVKAQLERLLIAQVPRRDEYVKTQSLLSAVSDVPGINMITTFGQALIQRRLEEEIMAEGTRYDRVVAAHRRAAWQGENQDKLEELWSRVLAYADSSPEFNAVWTGAIGSTYGIAGNVSLNWLAQDPVLRLDGRLTEVMDLLRSEQVDRAQLATMVRELFAEYGDAVQGLRTGIANDLERALQERDLRAAAEQAAHDAALAQAAQRKERIDAISAAFSIASVVARLSGNPRLATEIELFGRSTVALVTAFNDYLPTIKGSNLAQILTSASTITFTGNVLGAVMILMPIFVDTGPTETELIISRIDALRGDVARLGAFMGDRFDRIDTSIRMLYGQMLAEFESVKRDHWRLTESVNDVASRLTSVSTKLDLYGRWQMDALGQSELRDFETMVDSAINYRQRTGRPLSDTEAGLYETAEGEFHTTALNTSTHTHFSVPVSDWNADPLLVLDNTSPLAAHGPYSALGYLANYAHGIDAAIPAPPGQVRNPTVWLAAASAYSLLQTQNPDIAASWPRTRADEIVAAGRNIQDVARPFSRPAPTADAQGRLTNTLFTTLMSRYDQGVADLVAAAEATRADVTYGRRFDIFGRSDQTVTPRAELATPATIEHCTTPGQPALSTPAGFTQAQALGAAYVVLSEMEPNQHGARSCWTAEWADVEYHYEQAGSGTFWHEGNLIVTIATEWNAGPAWVPARKVVRDLGRETLLRTVNYHQLVNQGTAEQALAARWDPIRDGVLTGAVESRDPDRDQAVRSAVQSILNQSQYQYYQLIADRLGGSNAVASAARAMSRALVLLRSYTQLGLPINLDNDDLMRALLFGGKDMPLLGGLTNEDHLTNVYRSAQSAYAGCDPRGPCRPLADQAALSLTTEAGDVCNPDAPIAGTDPVTACLQRSVLARSTTLGQRYATAFARIAAAGVVEEMPLVSAAVDDLTWTTRVLHAPRLPVLVKDGWSLVSVDSQEAGAGGANAFDLDVNTSWRTRTAGGTAPLPHEIVLDLGQVNDIDALTYTPRQDGNAAGRIGEYEIYVSNYIDDWGKPVAAGRFRDVARAQTARLPYPATGRYLRLRALTEAGNRTGFIAVAEIDAFGVAHRTDPVDRSVPLPRDGWSVSVDSAETTSENAPAAHAVDGDPATKWVSAWTGGIAGLPHHFTVDLGAVQLVDGLTYLPRQDHTPRGGQYAGYIGRYEVYLSADGNAWSAPVASGTFADDPSRQAVRIVPAEARYVRLVALTEAGGRATITSIAELNITTPRSDPLPRTGWSVSSVDSEELVGETAPRGYAIDGDPSTFWHSRWAATPAPLPHHITVDLGSAQVVDGLTYQPRLDGGVNGTVGRYEVYLSTTGTGWGAPVTSGRFVDNRLAKEVHFPARTARFVKLVALSEAGDRGPWTAVAELGITTPHAEELPRAAWSVHGTDSEAAGADSAAGNAVDGDPRTSWTSGASVATLPHYLAVDLGGQRWVNVVTYLPRQTGTRAGRIGRYEVYVSTDGTTWGSPVASGSFADSQLTQTARFAPRWARYVKLVALSEPGSGSAASIAEFGVAAPYSQQPYRLESRSSGSCLAATGPTTVGVAACDPAAAGQQWVYGVAVPADPPAGWLLTRDSGRCVTAESVAGSTHLALAPVSDGVCGAFTLSQWPQGTVLLYWFGAEPLAVASVPIGGRLPLEPADDADTHLWVPHAPA